MARRASLTLRWLRPARSELRSAARFYDRERPGLGDEFLDEIAHALERIIVFPEAWVEISHGIRRCAIRRFPYGILYEVRDTEVVILAVMHQSRAPDAWRDRLASD